MKDGRARNVEAPFVRRPHNFDVAFFFVVVVVPSFIFFFPSSCLGQVRHRRFHRLAFCFVFVVFFVALWTIFKKKKGSKELSDQVLHVGRRWWRTWRSNGSVEARKPSSSCSFFYNYYRNCGRTFRALRALFHLEMKRKQGSRACLVFVVVGCLFRFSLSVSLSFFLSFFFLFGFGQ